MKEVQIDTLVGPTHFYGGLSYGNVASMSSRFVTSNPKLAALQGLEKMKLVHELGAIQLVLPPHPRPAVAMLQNLGFSGSIQEIIENAYKNAPQLLMQCSSQSAMWTANAATVTPSSDTLDKKVHITPANLISHLHRSIETPFTAKLLKATFSNSRYFVHHSPLPSVQEFADEGAANHTRFCNGKKWLHLFVYGVEEVKETVRFPARQSLASQEAIARRHRLDPKRIVFAQQNPRAIDKGVFHNDVIAVGHEKLFFYHEEGFKDTQGLLDALSAKIPLTLVGIKSKQLTVEEAVKSYIFNSQILTMDDGSYAIICPEEVKLSTRAKAIVENELPIKEVHYFPLQQSMKNGGGPACLRLRLPLNENEIGAIYPFVFFSPSLYEKLKAIINSEYPDAYHPKDLLDPLFRRHLMHAVKKIAKALKLDDLE